MRKWRRGPLDGRSDINPQSGKILQLTPFPTTQTLQISLHTPTTHPPTAHTPKTPTKLSSANTPSGPPIISYYTPQSINNNTQELESDEFGKAINIKTAIILQKIFHFVRKIHIAMNLIPNDLSLQNCLELVKGWEEMRRDGRRRGGRGRGRNSGDGAC